jgi:ABC-type antimicrobial peptide transport system ATPase subunit
MEGEFTNYCKQYYELLQQVDQKERRLIGLIDNALPYTGQTDVAELDAIISCNRRILKAHDATDDVIEAKQETEAIILKILEYFEIPANTRLTCEVPGLYMLTLWADEENTVYCFKTHDLAPLEQDEHIITIQLTDSRNDWDEDDE